MRKALIILGDLDDRDIGWLARSGVVRQLVAGERLIDAGRAIDHLYFITEGKLRVTTPGGQPLATLETGEVVGEMSFVQKRLPTANVAALTDCRVLAIPRAAMLAEFALDNGMAMRFYRAMAVFLSDRLQAMTGEDSADLDELILDNLTLAGDRFLRLIARLEGRDI
ncbi:cyclic nucleotide-binding domain-containing protein [Sandarakinorhabdus sp.]|uniref:cyclic nucleotide-binding domain-containing protein n=1 Tax=Sandarakinorhabdus sp. TaxID=1916663 RepID=UPI00333FBBA9